MKNHDLKKLWKMFMVFFRIGAFTIGGGYAMLPLIEKEVVDNNKWVSEEDIVDVYAISQSVPGVIAINSSIFIGYKVSGYTGAIIAALGVILPSFFIILIIAYLLFNIQNNIYLEKAFTGVRAGVTAMILLSVIKLAKSAVKDKLGVVLAVASFITIVVFDIHAIIAIVTGGFIGYLAYGLGMLKKKNI
ncbi:MAG: chrA1 [Clostridiales bacterium]|jgi:chromate transporter|nr:chrA1 [Clostridiales bacterium]